MTSPTHALRATATTLGAALALLLTAGVTPASAYVPGDYCEGAPNANYSHPDRLDAFVQCSNELAYVFDCQPGLHYNPQPRPWGQCDWPHNDYEQVYPPGYQPE